MRIQLITPAPLDSKAGNRTTAIRWKNILTSLGHRVQVSQQYQGENTDVLIALHAWRSANSILRFAQQHTHKPLIVALTGTDIYRFIHSHPQVTLQSIQASDVLIGLHANVFKVLPPAAQKKLTIIYQSAKPLHTREPVKRHFRICVAGHLREEKDPLRTAIAAQSLPKNSRIEIVHYGKAHSADWAAKAKSEMQNNLRYHWFGEVRHDQLRKIYTRSHLFVLSSVMEGGANVISEAVMAELPVVASHIDGNTGLLGDDYVGYFSPGNAQELSELMYRAEKDADFYLQLSTQCRQRQSLFSYNQELKSWRNLLNKIEK